MCRTIVSSLIAFALAFGADSASAPKEGRHLSWWDTHGAAAEPKADSGKAKPRASQAKPAAATGPAAKPETGTKTSQVKPSLNGEADSTIKPAAAEASAAQKASPTNNTSVKVAPADASPAPVAAGPAPIQPAQILEAIEQLKVALRDLAERDARTEKTLEELRRNVNAPSASAGVAQTTNSSPEAKSPAASALLPDATLNTQGQVTPNVKPAAPDKSEKPREFGGFRFAGDLRLRADVQARTGNSVAAPLHNIRGRYRVRLNVDREMDSKFYFHMQLSTGALNNGLTNDQDFGSTIAKQPFSLSEAYVDFHPNPNVALRAGRMEEVFADNTRFLWDDDVRFNGFQQAVRFRVPTAFLGIDRLEIRAGEYILSNPNVAILPASSPFVSAGYLTGQKVRDSNLFHPGFVIHGQLGRRFAHQVYLDAQMYRNPNQIQLASLTAGVPVLVGNGFGLTLSGPMSGSGNATTTAGGAISTARSFQIAHIGYRLEDKGLLIHGSEIPAWLDFQVSRNLGTGKMRDAMMASANLGAVKKAGDIRLLYQFAIKDANSMISQFTDDDLGTGSGVNIRVHGMRIDLGLAKFLQWQNLFFVLTPLRANNPADSFFVPLQQGANTTFRGLSQLAFTF